MTALEQAAKNYIHATTMLALFKRAVVKNVAYKNCWWCKRGQHVEDLPRERIAEHTTLLVNAEHALGTLRWHAEHDCITEDCQPTQPAEHLE